MGRLLALSVLDRVVRVLVLGVVREILVVVVIVVTLSATVVIVLVVVSGGVVAHAVARCAVISRVIVVSIAIIRLVVLGVVDTVGVGSPLIIVVVPVVVVHGGGVVRRTHVRAVCVCGTVTGVGVVVNDTSVHDWLNSVHSLAIDIGDGVLNTDVLNNGVVSGSGPWVNKSTMASVTGSVIDTADAGSGSTSPGVNGASRVESLMLPLSSSSGNSLSSVSRSAHLLSSDERLIPGVLRSGVGIVVSIEVNLRVLVVRLQVVAHLPVLTWHVGNLALVDALDKLASVAINAHVAVLASNMLTGVVTTISVSVVAVHASVSIAVDTVGTGTMALEVAAEAAEGRRVLGISDKRTLVRARADSFAEVSVRNWAAELVLSGNWIVLSVV